MANILHEIAKKLLKSSTRPSWIRANLHLISEHVTCLNFDKPQRISRVSLRIVFRMQRFVVAFKPATITSDNIRRPSDPLDIFIIIFKNETFYTHTRIYKYMTNFNTDNRRTTKMTRS